MSDDKLPINEVFETIQGEATYTGTPSVFLRLQGCPVGCGWCDTKHTWKVSNLFESDMVYVLSKQEDDQCFAWATPEEIVQLVHSYHAKHIVITGGEPCLYDLHHLTMMLMDAGWTVQVETSGTHPISVAHGTWVTVSPKVGMPGGFKVLPEAIARADEIKFPVGKYKDIDVLTEFLAEHNILGYLADHETKVPVWLQPLSKSPSATNICVNAAITNGWKVSIQSHKYMGIR